MSFNRDRMSLDFQKIFYVIASLFGIIAIMFFAKPILIPLAFAMLLAFILFPLMKRFERMGMGVIMATITSMLLTALFLAIGIVLFSAQIVGLSEDFDEFQNKLLNVFVEATTFINQNFGFIDDLETQDLINQVKRWINNSAGMLARQTFSGTAAFLTGLVSTVIFTFLILIYYRGLTHAFVMFYPEDKRERATRLFKSVQQVGQKYLSGMVLIITILGFVNSFGLMIIGVDNPLLFGFMASILAIIPYVGTVLGAAIPVLYAFLTYDSFWMPVAVAFMFWMVQVIESNFLTPKVVGGSLKVNALTAILSIIIGASIWGVAGMILFLPFAAMLKVVSAEYIELKPVALLIGEQGEEDEKPALPIWRKVKRKVKAWLNR